MRKLYPIILSFLLIMTLTACQKTNVDEETESHYIGMAKEVIELLLDYEFEEVFQRFNEELEESLPASELEDILTPLIKKVGKFESYEVYAVEERDDLFVTVVVTKHEDGKLGFTITFEEDGKIAGLFLK